MALCLGKLLFSTSVSICLTLVVRKPVLWERFCKQHLPFRDLPQFDNLLMAGINKVFSNKVRVCGCCFCNLWSLYRKLARVGTSMLGWHILFVKTFSISFAFNPSKCTYASVVNVGTFRRERSTLFSSSQPRNSRLR